jgi:hypothetical protein
MSAYAHSSYKTYISVFDPPQKKELKRGPLELKCQPKQY